MKLRRIIEKTLDSLRIAVITVAILALGFSGAGAAARLFVDESVVDTALEFASPYNVLRPTPDPDEAAHGMEPGSLPCTEQPARLQSLVLLTGNSSQHRMVNRDLVFQADIAGFSIQISRHEVPSAPGLVNSKLGRQLTLVGAKPSGTS